MLHMWQGINSIDPRQFESSTVVAKTSHGHSSTFIREHARVLRAPLASTMESCPARASNLFGAVTNGKPVSSAMSAAISSSYPLKKYKTAVG